MSGRWKEDVWFKFENVHVMSSMSLNRVDRPPRSLFRLDATTTKLAAAATTTKRLAPEPSTSHVWFQSL